LAAALAQKEQRDGGNEKQGYEGPKRVESVDENDRGPEAGEKKKRGGEGFEDCGEERRSGGPGGMRRLALGERFWQRPQTSGQEKQRQRDGAEREKPMGRREAGVRKTAKLEDKEPVQQRMKRAEAGVVRTESENRKSSSGKKGHDERAEAEEPDGDGEGVGVRKFAE